MQNTGQKLWGEILSQIKLQVPTSTFKTWFAGSCVMEFKESEERKLLIIGVKNKFLKEQVELRYLPMISEIKERKSLNDVEIVFLVSRSEPETSFKIGPLFSGEAPKLSVSSRKFEALNPAFTFEKFVVGETNNLAHVASLQVAKNLGQFYNPLLIYGPTGVGKTHLLHAVGNEAIDKTIDLKVLYTTSERFTNEYIQSLNNKTQQIFRQKYRNVDLLLFDDIQFLAGKESTQDEFFHCYNELTLSGKQVVAVSDRHPKELTRIKERLISRFFGGMVADIGYPDFEMKVAIIKSKCKEKGMHLDRDVVEYIASESYGGARELEGVLTTTMAKIKLSGGKLVRDEIKKVVLVSSSENKRAPSIKKITSAVCNYFNIKEGALKDSSRKAHLVKARQTLMYFLRRDGGLSLSDIGTIAGGRDHSTVIYGFDKVSRLILSDTKFRDDILRIKEVIHN